MADANPLALMTFRADRVTIRESSIGLHGQPEARTGYVFSARPKTNE